MAFAGTMLETATINVDCSRLHKMHLAQRPNVVGHSMSPEGPVHEQRCHVKYHERGRIYLVKRAFEASIFLGAVIPFSVDNAKRNILVWGACNEPDQARVLLTCSSKRFSSSAAVFPNNLESWCFCLVDKFWIEDVEFVTLDNLGWWIIMIIMSLVIFIPVVAHLHTIEISRFSGSVLVCPLRLGRSDSFFAREYLLVLVDASSNLAIIQCFGSLGEVLVGLRKAFGARRGGFRRMA